MADAQLRVWCFRCFRWRDITLETLGNGGMSGETEFAAVARRFRCITCRRSDQVLVLPASVPGSPGRSRDYSGESAGAALVAGYFHAMRGAGKRAKRLR
mgnify:CR=1 FL=1